ncbi:MAG: signal recognition particle receptor subunit alpha [Candidatus Marsarchaeota archaeon]|nr:signal recognition particle receptor subunit alpha [Candidatus Marsarchaeota archaeon]
MDLGKGLRTALAKLTGRALVDEAAVKEFLRDIQRVLIANDVPVKLVFELSKRIEKRVLGAEAAPGLSLREQVVRAIYDELVALLGEKYEPDLRPRRLVLLGLYGSGKTTTCGKLAQFYKKRGLSVALVCADTDRPAAYAQLQQLSAKCGASFHGIEGEKEAKKILQRHLPLLKEDLVIVDSAGRSGFDEELVKQLKIIVEEVKPQEKILVMSADIGQTAARQAEQFNTAVGLTGVIITKLDGSGKGGGALAACHAAKVPVLYIGRGEKLEDFEPFDSKKFVGRLLGFPDFEALMEKIKEAGVQAEMKEQQMDKLTLGAFYSQLKAARKMGPLSSVFGMMGMSDLPPDMMKTSEQKLKKYEAIIGSMTQHERDNAEVLRKQKGRIERIAKGAGCKPEEVRELLTQFEKMANLVNGFKKNRGLRKKLEKMMGKSGVDMSKLQGMMGG